MTESDDLGHDEPGRCEWCSAERCGDYRYGDTRVCAGCLRGAELADDQAAYEPRCSYH